MCGVSLYRGRRGPHPQAGEKRNREEKQHDWETTVFV